MLFKNNLCSHAAIRNLLQNRQLYKQVLNIWLLFHEHKGNHHSGILPVSQECVILSKLEMILRCTQSMLPSDKFIYLIWLISEQLEWITNKRGRLFFFLIQDMAGVIFTWPLMERSKVSYVQFKSGKPILDS